MNLLTGINFEEQPMRPNDFGRVLEGVLSDGILQGCGIAFSGTTLSMAAGYIIAGGKLLKNPSALSIAVDQAVSGYARLLGTIDLSLTATEDTFDQAALTVEYSSTVDGFPSLTQQDINGSGTVYQFVLAVVSLGSGGISAIVQTIGQAHGSLDRVYTLHAAGWVNNLQTVAVPGTGTGRRVDVSPHHPRANISAYGESGVLCIDETEGSLTFECETVPTVDLAVNISVLL